MNIPSAFHNTSNSPNDVSSVVYSVQEFVALLSEKIGLSEDLVRICKADIVETLLHKGARFILDDKAYTACSTAEQQSQFLESHLTQALFCWLSLHKLSWAQTLDLGHVLGIDPRTITRMQHGFN